MSRPNPRLCRLLLAGCLIPAACSKAPLGGAGAVDAGQPSDALAAADAPPGPDGRLLDIPEVARPHPAPEAGLASDAPADPDAGLVSADALDDGPGRAPDGEPPGVQPPPAQVGPSTLRRLTARQYLRTVRDLLGVVDDRVTLMSLPADEAIAGRFDTPGPGYLGVADADRYAEAATRLASAAIRNLGSLLPCTPAAGASDPVCASRFIESFGRRAYRRPLTPAEREALARLHATGEDFATGTRLVLEAMLQSPNFLYLVEPAPQDAQAKPLPLDGWAMAARLSYGLVGSLPDDILLDAAARGTLGTPEQVAAQATRLMRDPRFREVVTLFHTQWLKLDDVYAHRDASMLPEWNAELRNLMVEQVGRFATSVVIDGDGRLDTLLAARHSFVRGPLRALYGLAGPPTTDWVRVDLPADQRAGLLTHAGVLAGPAVEPETAFIHRGVLLRESVLCGEMPPSPAGMPGLRAGSTARERAAGVTDLECAKACHVLIDPLGFGFENYDAIGRYRTTEGGKPIDSVFQFPDTGALAGTYDGAVGLAPKLGGAPEVQRCFATQWLRFLLNRRDVIDDTRSIDGAVTAMKGAGGSIQALLTGLVRSNSFRYQKDHP